MIVKCTAQETRDLFSVLRGKGYSFISNAILPNIIKGDNYVEVEQRFAMYSYTSPERAEEKGYVEFKDFKA